MLTSLGKHVTRGGRGGALPCPFSKIGKTCPSLEKKRPNCDYLWVKFPIQNEISKSFQAKNQIFFPGGTTLSRVVGECLSNCPDSKKTPLP